ncbi:MAG: LysR family transcriptional regulator [Actinomycetota bacterium]
MDWTARQLRAIVTVAERGNISHAAVHLGLTQPTVSRMLSRVEADLGTPLFERSPGGASLTEAGVGFVATAAEVLRAMEERTDEIRSREGRLVGKICVAMPDTIGHTLFIPLIDRFSEQHPDVELRVMALHPNSIPLALTAGDADVGVVSSAHRLSGVRPTPLAVEPLHLVGAGPSADGFGRAGVVPGGEVSLDEVALRPLLLPAIQPGLRSLIDAAFAQRQLRPNVVLDVDAEDAIIELVSSGRAFSIMSYAGIQRFVATGLLAAGRIIDPPIERVLSTAVPDNRPVTRLMEAVDAAVRQLTVELQAEARWVPRDA